MPTITPGHPTPDLIVPTVSHGTYNLAKERAKRFTLLVFFRGYHCSICMEYIHDLASRLNQFKKLGISVIALSCDTLERARQTAEEWHLGDLPLAYGVTVAQAREWGLYISRKIANHEPEMFCEPGMFVVTPKRTLYSVQVQSHPFSRVDLAQVVKDFEYIIERNYPARGEA